ncbi:MAG: tRNA preQ1(34) S-adenosylmethionine ribosyltransferase-isomerase QueA [Burkholderiales bacterium]|nr:tRNA preQ1(34) S-adenosylmethionine ribosyltransferase-isomerase QueA [Burkholderiales bacterium]
MNLTDFDYYLPEELIAQHPAAERAGSRLLHLDGNTGTITDRQFADLAAFIAPNDVLVFNDTKVIKARLHGRKETGGSAEVLVERVLADGRSALAHVRASKSPKPGSRLNFTGSVVATMVARVDDLFQLQFDGDLTVHEILERYGEVPLPPYITHQADLADEARYQTVYAKHVGSVAAPTAGLHFDDAMLAALRAKGVALAYVTLHVGAGTFQPVRDNDISKHVMHSEWYDLPAATVAAISAAKAAGGRVIAVGTTSMRTLEAAARDGSLQAESAETRIMITPGYAFQTVDRLITNFHLPKSTLMMLVSAFAGTENIQRAYAHAVAARYRFFSYGDAMLLEKRA